MKTPPEGFACDGGAQTDRNFQSSGCCSRPKRLSGQPFKFGHEGRERGQATTKSDGSEVQNMRVNPVANGIEPAKDETGENVDPECCGQERSARDFHRENLSRHRTQCASDKDGQKHQGAALCT